MKDLTGMEIGMWNVIKRAKNGRSQETRWECECKNCNKIKDIESQLLRKKTPKCDCINSLKDKKFGRLFVREKDTYKRNRNTLWICECDCGNICSVSTNQLKSGRTISCGCYAKEQRIKANKKYNTYDLTGEYGIGHTSNGKIFYFDLEDYDKIKDYCWCITSGCEIGYLGCYTKEFKILMHIFIMNCYGEKGKMIDHINHNTLDNRKENLRVCTNQQNQWNRLEAKTNTSGHKGVVKHNNGMKDYWRGQLVVNSKQYTKSYPILNYGNDKAYELACKWVEEKDIELHGEFSPYYNNREDIYYE